MAKILVADDNSNIQKMVGLALKDQGIDVVAVGNGEAAVRKISDVRPDLVLADVFMPVRNGYEVCKYVKDDSALAHIPVILLVGAFDPLDEQEAQRVGADGVLKKPFVPPDPLISMVKSALTRSGVYSGSSSDKPEAAPLAAVEMIAPREPAIPVMGEVAKIDEVPELVMTKPEPLNIGSGAPLAFSSLLETPTAEQEEEDLGYAVPVQPATERNWGASDEEDEEEQNEEEEKPQASWRAASDTFEDKKDEVSAGARDWRDTTFDQPTVSPRKSSSGAWKPGHEKSPLTEAAEDVVTAAQEARPMSAPIPISDSRGPATVSPFTRGTSSVALAEGSSSFADEAVDAVPQAEETTPVSARAPENAARAIKTPAAIALEEPASGKSVAPTPVEAKETEAPKPASTDSWFTTAPSPWDTEVRKASQLASTWDMPASVSTSTPSQPGHETPAPVAHEKAAEAALETASEPSPAPSAYAQHSELTETVIAKAEEAGLSAYAVEAIREEVAEVTESAAAAPEAVQEMPAPKVEVPAETNQPSTDELVAKVLAKMNPEVLQAVTREILKPVVEAIVRDELNSKKS